jgi:TatD DNase family protein
MTPRWIDTHCHVHDERIPGGTAAAVTAALEAGVTTMITVGCDRDTSIAALNAASAHPEVRATIGLHPHDASDGVDTITDLIDEIERSRPGALVALGEAGLDYHYEHSARDVQRRAFAEQIALAHRYRLPLVVHTREAWDETFEILAAETAPEQTILHCFSGGPDEMSRALELGAWISFSGIVSFPNATEVRAAARICPLESMLLETDSPYLAPVPHRGRPNQPAWVNDVGAAVADLRGIDPSEVARHTTAAARRAFPRLAAHPDARTAQE